MGEGWGICYDYAIHYLGVCQPVYRQLVLPEDADYEVDVIDTWNMTITPAGVKRVYGIAGTQGRIRSSKAERDPAEVYIRGVSVSVQGYCAFTTFLFINLL